MFSFYEHDLGRGWAVLVVVGRDCLGRRNTSGRKKGARGGR